MIKLRDVEPIAIYVLDQQFPIVAFDDHLVVVPSLHLHEVHIDQQFLQVVQRFLHVLFVLLFDAVSEEIFDLFVLVHSDAC